MVRLEANTVERLDEKVREFTDVVIQSGVQSDPFQERVSAIHNMGNKEIRATRPAFRTGSWIGR